MATAHYNNQATHTTEGDDTHPTRTVTHSRLSLAGPARPVVAYSRVGSPRAGRTTAPLPHPREPGPDRSKGLTDGSSFLFFSTHLGWHRRPSLGADKHARAQLRGVENQRLFMLELFVVRYRNLHFNTRPQVGPKSGDVRGGFAVAVIPRVSLATQRQACRKNGCRVAVQWCQP